MLKQRVIKRVLAAKNAVASDPYVRSETDPKSLSSYMPLINKLKAFKAKVDPRTYKVIYTYLLRFIDIVDSSLSSGRKGVTHLRQYFKRNSQLINKLLLRQ